MLIYRTNNPTLATLRTRLGIKIKDSSNDIWSEDEFDSAITNSLAYLFPKFYVPVIDITSISTTSGTYGYDISDVDIDELADVRAKDTGSNRYSHISYWLENQTLVLESDPGVATTLKLMGGKKFTALSDAADTTDIPSFAEDIFVLYAGIELMRIMLRDKGKMNQFAARQQEITENDVINIIREMERELESKIAEKQMLPISQSGNAY